MNTCNSESHGRSANWLILLLVVLIVSFVVVAVSTAVAAPAHEQKGQCDDGKDNDNDGFIDAADTDCQGDGGSGGGDDPQPSNTPIRASWPDDGGAITEPDAGADGLPDRACVAGVIKPSGDKGNYSCTRELPKITYELSLISPPPALEKSGLLQDLCHEFEDGITLLPNSPPAPQVIWQSARKNNCNTGPCDVWVTGHVVGRVQFPDLPQEWDRVYRLLITSSGMLPPQGEGNDLNPFTRDQDVQIDRVTVGILGDHRRDNSTCEWTIEPGAGPIFQITPDP